MKIKMLLSGIVLSISSFFTVQAQMRLKVNSQEVSAMLNKDKELIVLDARSANEFKQGHIKGAINIDILQKEAFSKIDKLNREDKYIVYCHTYRRSGMTVDHMAKSGFKTVYQMIDGFAGWTANMLTVQK